MRRAVATVSLSGSLRDKLEAIAAAGFDAIELFENDFINSPASASELRRQCSDLGLGIDLYQPFRDFEGMPDALHAKNLVRAERKFDVMQQLGATLMLVCSNTSPASTGDAARAVAQLHELAERAARRGLRIGFEALAWGRHVNRYGQAWSLVEQAAHPQLGLVLDSFHTLSLNDDAGAIARIPGDKIFFVQMADAPLLAMDVLQWARHFRNFPGQGQFDVVGFFEQVLRSGYAGTLSLEIFNDVFRETPNRRTAVDAMRSLLWLENEAAARLTQAGVHAVPARVELAAIPAASKLGGVAFIEFGVDDDTARALEQVLGQLGFVRAGRHRSKRCTLWRQGALRFVVNAEPGSDARARFAEQGAVVSAIGLASDDAARAVARAAALLSAPFDSPLGAGELHLPAFRSPGGMLLHFVPQAHGASGFAEVDFISEPVNADAHGAGLTHVDHLALALTADQLDTWVLFARAVLALEVGDSIDLADPFGLVRSSSVATADRALRLVLDVSQSRRTAAARTVALHGGKPAVHTIALACADIFASVAALRARGFAFVEVSPNVHDDLVARFDLEPGLAQQLRQAGVLYDRNADGEYLHAFGQPFAGRFAFELVQRNGYDAYGALNRAVRLAAPAGAPALAQQHWNRLL